MGSPSPVVETAHARTRQRRRRLDPQSRRRREPLHPGLDGLRVRHTRRGGGEARAARAGHACVGEDLVERHRPGLARPAPGPDPAVRRPDPRPLRQVPRGTAADRRGHPRSLLRGRRNAGACARLARDARRPRFLLPAGGRHQHPVHAGHVGVDPVAPDPGGRVEHDGGGKAIRRRGGRLARHRGRRSRGGRAARGGRRPCRRERREARRHAGHDQAAHVRAGARDARGCGGQPPVPSAVKFRRMPIEIESPEELGYDTIANNLSESSFSDMRLSDHAIDSDVGDLLLQYGDHLGLPRLREQIATAPLQADDVLVTAGAAAALFIVASALVQPGDHIVVLRPNYATNLETPRAIGADVEYLDLRFEDGWALDTDRVAAALRPDTRLVSLTYPHNPTGAMLDPGQLQQLAELVDQHPSARLLLDETYRELAYDAPLPQVAALSESGIGVSSMSKVFGMPGLRIGWIACRDPELKETLLAAKEQILLAGATIDEELAARVLEARPRLLPLIRAKVERHLAIVRDWIEGQDVFEWVEPRAGVVGFLRFRPEVDLDVDRFYERLLAVHGTYVGPGHWFDQERRSFRLGFAWPETDELERGLAGLLGAAGES